MPGSDFRKNLEAEIEKVTDFNKFADLGIMMTPGLIINERLVSSGKIPAKWTLERWITEAYEHA